MKNWSGEAFIKIKGEDDTGKIRGWDKYFISIASQC